MEGKKMNITITLTEQELDLVWDAIYGIYATSAMRRDGVNEELIHSICDKIRRVTKEMED
jgi:hypothetical protein